MYLGIDGGGTRLRVAVCDDQFSVLHQREYGSVNPGSIGRDAARVLIQTAVRETLSDIQITGGDIEAVGVGIAGLSAEHSTAWLSDVMREVLSEPYIALSSDVEIALVGAHGRRCGVLVLAGTGSAVYGVNTLGQSVMVGGWGYLLGDEGSGYWVGLQALRLFTRAADGQQLTVSEAQSRLPQCVAEQLQLSRPKELISWLYGEPATAAARLAGLAPLVLTEAERGDEYAISILSAGAKHLAEMAKNARMLLHEPDLPVAFAGGMLSGDNALSRSLCIALNLREQPVSQYSPVVGAAILAKQRLTEQKAVGD